METTITRSIQRMVKIAKCPICSNTLTTTIILEKPLPFECESKVININHSEVNEEECIYEEIPPINRGKIVTKVK